MNNWITFKPTPPNFIQPIMDQFTETLQAHWASLWAALPTLLYALLFFIVFIIIGHFVAAVVKRGFQRASFSVAYQSFFLKIVRWVFGIAGFLVALKILGFSGIATSILAGGGVTAIVLGFAFKDIGENILAGFFLAFSRPFNVGDLIRSEDLEGRVQNVDLRHTHIRTGDGCDIYIPSSQIFKMPLMNFTRDGLRRASFTIGIDYADDAEQALNLLQQTVENIDQIIEEPPPKANIAAFTPNYVEINITFWINTFKQEKLLADLRTEAMNACRLALLKNEFTVSSSVSTALTMAPLTVNVEKGDK